MLFADLGLCPELLRALADEGYTQPTPIQAQAIPVVLSGRDLLGAAQTGTGKTAAFTLPILQQLQSVPPPAGPRLLPRVLVLVPTRELAAQVGESVRTYGRHLPALKTAIIFGGVGINPQIDQLRRGVDLIVATPGRLLDHLQQRTVNLSGIQMLVLDEADRMLDMGFIRDIRRVIQALPSKRQNLLFSATFNPDIRALAEGLLHDPASVDVAPRNTAAQTVAQRVHPVDKSRKTALIAHLVKQGDWKQVLIFTRTKHGANRLAEQLVREGILADAIHGNKSQNARTRALADFKAGKIRVLVATDIAARGIDIDQLPHVINHELPNVPEDYVHRIGRTGRAGAEGEAISLVSSEERQELKDIQRLLKRDIPSSTVPGFEPGSQPSAEERAAAAARPPMPPERDRPRAPGGRGHAPSGGNRRPGGGGAGAGNG
ncbi:MAG TPA: DEAD/DEAH box helicase, partial [Nevskia sp.]|nr:DEAD/DEAH box helicase [Nevskia sp.]